MRQHDCWGAPARLGLCWNFHSFAPSRSDQNQSGLGSGKMLSFSFGHVRLGVSRVAGGPRHLSRARVVRQPSQLSTHRWALPNPIWQVWSSFMIIPSVLFDTACSRSQGWVGFSPCESSTGPNSAPGLHPVHPASIRCTRAGLHRWPVQQTASSRCWQEPVWVRVMRPRTSKMVLSTYPAPRILLNFSVCKFCWTLRSSKSKVLKPRLRKPQFQGQHDGSS